MKKIINLFLFITIISMIFAYEPFFLDDPAISPDGELICFVYMNDLWEVPYEGGIARRLTSRQGNVYRPAYSLDGQWITFHSNRDGRAYFYKIPTIGGQSELITKEEFTFCDWFPNDKGNYSSLSMLGVMHHPGEESFFVKYDFNGLRPVEITEVAESFASVSRNGEYIVFNRRGYPYRMAYQGSHNGDLWLYYIKNAEFTRLTDTALTERYPVFSKVNENRIYFLASDSTNFQLCYMDDFNDSTRVWLTDFTEWSPRDISIAHENDRIVFEYFNEIWRWDPDKNIAEKVIVDILEDNLPSNESISRFKNELSNFYISKDQKLIVFSHKYDLFAIPANGGDVKQLTNNQKGIENIVIMDDNETIYYTSHDKGIPKLYKLNINDIVNVNRDDYSKRLVKWSEDKYIQSLAKNDDGELFIRYDKGNERLLFAKIDRNNRISDIASGENIASFPKKSPKYNKEIYTLLDSKNWNRTIRIKDNKTNRNYDIHYSTKYIGNLLISDDESKLFYNNGWNINVVNLISETDKKEDNWNNILKNTTNNSKLVDKTPKDWDISFENFNSRTKEIVNDEGFCYPLFTTTDSTLFYIQRNNNNHFLKKIKFDGSKKEDVFNFRGNVSSHLVNQEKNTIYYVLNNNLHKLDIKSKKTDLITFEYIYNYDIYKLNMEIFEQVWAKFGHNFYDPEMHNQDWQALYNKFLPHIDSVLEPEILKKLIDEMIGRINASHTGYYPRKENEMKFFDRVYAGFVPDYSERLPVGLRIKKIYHGSELYQTYRISVNDILLSVNDEPVYATTDLTPLFVNTLGDYLTLRFQTSQGEVMAKVKGLSAREQYQLQYEDKILKRYQKVQNATNGKIGYLHIQGMNQVSLRKFEQDFLAVNVNTDAMIIDVRGNGGGNIHDDLIDIIIRSQNAYTYSRYYGIEPRPTPHNIYQKPIVCLIDEDSFSDAEIFGVLFRDLNLGTVIGMPTSGSVIGTGSVSFMDGSSMRMPSSAWFRMNMQNMELNGAVPDIEIPLLPVHIIKNQDPQLDKAIEVLLKKIND